MMKTFDKELIQGYVHRTFPVQWANWWAKVQDRQARDDLGRVIFDDETLRDLTEPSVRGEVIACVLRHQSLMDLVETECEAAIDRMLEEETESEP